MLGEVHEDGGDGGGGSLISGILVGSQGGECGRSDDDDSGVVRVVTIMFSVSFCLLFC